MGEVRPVSAACNKLYEHAELRKVSVPRSKIVSLVANAIVARSIMLIQKLGKA